MSSHLISSHLMSCLLNVFHLISSHLMSSLLFSAVLISYLLKSSELFSSLLSSSELFSYQLFSASPFYAACLIEKHGSLICAIFPATYLDYFLWYQFGMMSQFSYSDSIMFRQMIGTISRYLRLCNVSSIALAFSLPSFSN